MAKKLSKNGYDFDFDNDIDGNEDGEERRPQPFPIQETIAVLESTENVDAVLPAGLIYGLSDLGAADLAVLRRAWPEIPVIQRRRAIQALSEVSETNFDLDFEALSYLAFDDNDPEVRAEAVGMTWYVNSERMFDRLMELVRDDNPTVRAAALEGLGRYIRDGELEEFDVKLAEQAQRIVLARYDDLRESDEVRRRALEAISYCSHPRVPDMIYEAYYADDPLMKASSLFAMGSSADTRWKELVIKELDNFIPEIRFEAVRAAGELELASATRRLIEMVYESDYEIRLMAVWSLGEIGTKEAREALINLAEVAEKHKDDDLAEAVDEALDMASLMGDQFFPMFNLEDDLDDVDGFGYDVEDEDFADWEYYGDEDDDDDATDWASLN